MTHDKQHKGHWKNDPVARIFTGIIIIWIGVSFLLKTQNLIDAADWWAYFLIGLGIILVVEVVVRFARPEYHRPVAGRLIAGVALIAIGSSGIFDLEEWWPLILIAVGVVVLLGGLNKTHQDSPPQ
ncbi:hypothetical protein JXJ21_22450 [candidate division KSB1 bacterium]|nr:hypothetical protein [candidate division KSB1 bacterium]